MEYYAGLLKKNTSGMKMCKFILHNKTEQIGHGHLIGIKCIAAISAQKILNNDLVLAGKFWGLKFTYLEDSQVSKASSLCLNITYEN